jgi:hypothetical protein
MRDVGKDSFVRSMEFRRDKVHSRILQEMSTMDNTEYERVCPVKFWYYNNLITNQQNTLIIDKQTTKTMPNEV